MDKYRKVCKREHIIYDKASTVDESVLKSLPIIMTQGEVHALSLAQQKVEKDRIVDMLKAELMIYEDAEGCATSFRWSDPFWLGYRKHIKDLIIKLNGK